MHGKQRLSENCLIMICRGLTLFLRRGIEPVTVWFSVTFIHWAARTLRQTEAKVGSLQLHQEEGHELPAGDEALSGREHLLATDTKKKCANQTSECPPCFPRPPAGENYWVFDAEMQIRGPESIRSLGLSVSGIQAALRWGHDSNYNTYTMQIPLL